MSKIAKFVGQRIRNYRTQLGLSQEKLAELAGVSIRTISDIERGITDIRYNNLLQIAEAFNIPIYDFLNFKL